MSNLNKALLAAAIATVVSGNLMAQTTIARTGDSNLYIHAREVLGVLSPDTNEDPRVTLGAPVSVNLASPNILIGRTNGSGDITVIVTLTGAEFVSAPDANGADNDCGTDADNEILVGSGTLNCGTVTASINSIQFTITPPVAPGFTSGSLITFPAGSLRFKDADALASGSISANVVIRDTNTNIELANTTNTLVTSAWASAATSDPNTTENDITIDVGTNSEKKLFLNTTTLTKLGTVSTARTTVGTAPTAGAAAALGTAATTNVASGLFVFDDVDTAGDEFITTAAGGDRAIITLIMPSKDGFLAANAVYAKKGDVVCGAFDAANDVPFALSGGNFVATVGLTSPTGEDFTICANADGDTPIIAQTIGVRVQNDLINTRAVDPGVYEDTTFVTWSYNGTVKTVQSFNPSTNAAVDSLLRVNNRSGISGLVTIDGSCQDGSNLTSTTFTLNSNRAVQYSSRELATGIATGTGKPALSAAMGDCPAGRSRLVVTGEFPEMEVQNFIRSTVSGATVTAGHNNVD